MFCSDNIAHCRFPPVGVVPVGRMAQEPARMACALKFLLVWQQKIISWFSRNDGFILSDICHVYVGESSSEIKANHCSFDGNDVRLLASIRTILGFAFLPVEYLFLHLRRHRTCSETGLLGFSDVFT